jgi:glucokinase
VCSPGLLEYERGIVKAAANLPWRDVPLTQLIADKLGVDRSSVVLENDGNTALLAELWVGAAKGKQDVVLLTLGTGIGAGIVCGGHLLHGHNGYAGELGHMILMPGGRPNAGTGVNGIWESYGSASAVRQRASEGLVPDGGHTGVGGVPTTSSLHPLTPTELNCKEVFKHAAAGDAYAKSIVRDTAKCLAIGSINCCRCYDPELILFTGGMAGAGEQLLEEVRAQFALPEHHWNIAPVTLEFKIAASPAHAGLIGAAYAARRSMRHL